MSLFVKICGITSCEDARLAADVGVRAIGLNFYPASPRYVTPDNAARIRDALPPDVIAVGVFVNENTDVVADVISTCALDMLQFHGEESPAFCQQFSLPYIRAFRPTTIEDLDAITAFHDARMALIDAYSPHAYGGTGHRADTALACAAKKYDIPVLLAGGLTPENVAAAIEAVRPFGVDVASGVEHAPGRKSQEKMRRFMREVRRAAHTPSNTQHTRVE